MGLALHPRFDRTVREHHECVVALRLKFLAVEVETRLVDIWLARGRTRRNAIPTLVAKITQDSNLECLVSDEPCAAYGLNTISTDDKFGAS